MFEKITQLTIEKEFQNAFMIILSSLCEVSQGVDGDLPITITYSGTESYAPNFENVKISSEFIDIDCTDNSTFNVLFAAKDDSFGIEVSSDNIVNIDVIPFKTCVDVCIKTKLDSNIVLSFKPWGLLSGILNIAAELSTDFYKLKEDYIKIYGDDNFYKLALYLNDKYDFVL